MNGNQDPPEEKLALELKQKKKRAAKPRELIETFYPKKPLEMVQNVIEISDGAHTQTNAEADTQIEDLIIEPVKVEKESGMAEFNRRLNPSKLSLLTPTSR